MEQFEPFARLCGVKITMGLSCTIICQYFDLGHGAETAFGRTLSARSWSYLKSFTPGCA